MPTEQPWCRCPLGVSTNRHELGCARALRDLGCDLPRPAKAEAIDHPQHYGGADNPFEAIKVIEAWQLDFCLGNAVKYISRAGKKGAALDDLRKARWYIDREITRLAASEASHE